MPSSAHHPDSFLPAMSAIAREAGALLLQYFNQGLKIEYKGEADLVTAADRAAETLIRERVSKQFPSHDVLGEEQGLNDQGSDYRWYVDPLDGTTNFAHGYPVFSVSMALEHQSLEERSSGQRTRRIAGVVSDPCIQDHAVKGMPGGDRVSQPEEAQESEYSLLSSDHAADARGAARGIGGARFV
jgi:fructose-1,6-bisphosphatase/inositol monophosphatase family enzyme